MELLVSIAILIGLFALSLCSALLFMTLCVVVKDVWLIFKEEFL